ncbi:hypothetical protein [Streptomyces sp. NPDC007369]|uniref:hypothetical protein n=1 Tax=Streptomyces sp. NPDC007369 TaxID=3154589 RepID=UPI0033C96F84
MAWRLDGRLSAHYAVLTGGSAGRTVKALEIDADSAQVTVVPGSGPAVDYRAGVSWSATQPDIGQSRLGETLRLKPLCGRRHLADRGLRLHRGPGHHRADWGPAEGQRE